MGIGLGTGLGTWQVKKTNTRHGGVACTGDVGGTGFCSLSSASNLRRIRVSLFFFVSMALIDILEFAALTVLIMFLCLFLSILFEGLLIGPDKVPGVIWYPWVPVPLIP